MDKTCFCGISEHCGYQIKTDMKQHDKVIFEDGYKKAIDDFLNELHKNIFSQNLFLSREGYMEKNYVVSLETIDRIAEQLKS